MHMGLQQLEKDKTWCLGLGGWSPKECVFPFLVNKASLYVILRRRICGGLSRQASMVSARGSLALDTALTSQYLKYGNCHHIFLPMPACNPEIQSTADKVSSQIPPLGKWY